MNAFNVGHVHRLCHRRLRRGANPGGNFLLQPCQDLLVRLVVQCAAQRLVTQKDCNTSAVLSTWVRVSRLAASRSSMARPGPDLASALLPPGLFAPIREAYLFLSACSFCFGDPFASGLLPFAAGPSPSCGKPPSSDASIRCGTNTTHSFSDVTMTTHFQRHIAFPTSAWSKHQMLDLVIFVFFFKQSNLGGSESMSRSLQAKKGRVSNLLGYGEPHGEIGRTPSTKRPPNAKHAPRRFFFKTPRGARRSALPQTRPRAPTAPRR